MPPKIPIEKNYRKRIPNIKNQNASETSFWVLLWHGRSYWNKHENRIYKEIYLVNVPNDKYIIKDWNSHRIITSTIPEEKTFLFPLGTLFDTKGRLFKRPFDLKTSKDYNQIYTLSNVNIHQENNYHVNGLFSLLKKTFYPVVEGDTFENVYENSPYYRVFHNTGYKMVEVIIPIHVINAYFYYLSTACTYHVIYNTLLYGIEKPRIIDDIPVVPFRGNIIRHQEAKKLAKYYFTNENKKNGLDLINYFSNEFMINLLREEQKIDKKYKGYFKSKIPFPGETKLNVIGQYISNGDIQKFIVYRITGDNYKFSLDKYMMLNLEDTRSIDIESPKNIIHYTSIKKLYKDQQIKNLDNGVNQNFETQNQIDKDNIELFNKTPKNELLDKEHQESLYYKDNVALTYFNGLNDDYRNHSSSSTNARVNDCYDSLNNNFQILNEVLTRLSDEKGFEINYIRLNNNTDTLYSFNPISNKISNSLFIVEIKYKKKCYCLIDAGIKRIGLIRYVKSNLGFSELDDSTLNNLLKFMIIDYNYDWSAAKKKQSLYMYGIQIIASMNHSRIEFDFEYSVELLMRKIKNKIENDAKNKIV